MSANESISKKSSNQFLKSPRIFTIGETTYDIQFREGVPSGGCAGGSAFNSAISLGRCGLPVTLVTTFAKDKVGDLAYQMLLQNNVDCSAIKRFEGRSRVALAFFDKKQNPEYSFYPASEEAIPEYPEPLESDLILLGSSFALRDKGREELLNYLRKSKEKGCVIIYDPNARRHLAQDPEMIRKITENISFATIVKGSDEDFHFIFNTNKSRPTYDLIQRIGSPCLFYTKGADGVELLTADLHLESGAKKINVVSTIGAGDNFSAGIVFGIYFKLLSKTSLEDFDVMDWQYVLSLGNDFAASVCQSDENYISVETGKNYISVETGRALDHSL